MRLRSDMRTGAAPAEAARWIGIPYLIVAALAGLQALIFPSVSHVDPLGPVTLPSVLQNLAGYFWAPAYFLRNIIGGNSALYLVLLPFFVFGVLKRWRGDLPAL
jgi:hypothetical protein